MKVARAYVQYILTKHRLTALIDSALVVTSELVTNAITHRRQPGSRDDTPSLNPHQGASIAVCCYLSGCAPVIEVWDNERMPPHRVNADAFDEGGRGLQLVDAMCKEWGYRWPKTGGKVVWCTLGS